MKTQCCPMNIGDRTNLNESHYWTLRRLDASNLHAWDQTKTDILPQAKDFFATRFASRQLQGRGTTGRLQNQLFELAHWDGATPSQEALLARLCLRCYVSHQIVSACRRAVWHALSLERDALNQLKQDILRCVLVDDGRLILNPYVPFSVEILTSFDPTRASLPFWTLYKVKQNPDVQSCFLHQGIIRRSDWAILNKARPREWMSAFEKHILTAFHQVYRRDRTGLKSHSGKPCPDPTPNQLQEMQLLLQKQGVGVTQSQLLKSLKELAQTCRQYDVSGNYRSIIASESLDRWREWDGKELPVDFADPTIPNNCIDQLEQQQQANYLELTPLCETELMNCLDQGIQQAVQNRIAALRRSRRQADCATQVVPGLKLLYEKGMSSRQIAAALGFKDGSKVSRVLEPERLVNMTRQYVIEQFLTKLLTILEQLAGRQALPQPLCQHDELVESITEYVDTQVFKRAIAEIKAGKNRTMDSLYAQRLLIFLNTV